MASADQRSNKEGAATEELEMGAAGGRKLGDHIPVYIPTLEEGLLHEEPRQKRFLDFLRAKPSRDWFLKLGLSGRFSAFPFMRRSSSQRDGSSPFSGPAPAPATPWRRRFRVSFVRKINWEALLRYGKKWIKNPVNMALLVWLAAVIVVLFIMLLVVSGLLNGAITESSRRKEWVEVTNQILNALFTIMCLYEHPKLAHHLVLLLRWAPRDVAALRTAYSKKGVARPHERAHISFVVALLHVTCFAQYSLCGIYWGFKRTDRPDFPQIFCFAVGTIAPVIAGVYTLYGPLGRKVEPVDTDDESRRQAAAVAGAAQGDLAAKVFDRKVVVERPQWVGGLFDCWDDMTVSYLSFFCTLCVFGWNMERLGFGNMYVHIATFVLLVVAPFLVFAGAGLSIDDNGVREAVGIVGILLCFLGLLYGGFWRIQMRKKFKLPANGICCGRPSLTDCMQWLFCWSCALAQEVRTGNFYDIEEGSFYSKQSSSSTASASEEEEGSSAGGVLQPLPREGGAGPVIKPGLESPMVVVVDPVAPAKAAEGHAGVDKGGRLRSQEDGMMTAPVPPSIQLEGKSNQQI